MRPDEGDDPRVEDLPNIGPRVAQVLAELGLRRRSDLDALGSVEVFRRVRAHLGTAAPRRFFLHGIEAALMGLPVAQLPLRRRAALGRALLELPPAGPAADVRPRNVIRARRRPRRRLSR